jgi:hypothetical protein
MADQPSLSNSQPATQSLPLSLSKKRTIMLFTAISIGTFAGIVTAVVLLNTTTNKPETKTPLATVPVITSLPNSPTPSPYLIFGWEKYSSSDAFISFQYPPELKVINNGSEIDLIDQTNDLQLNMDNIKTQILISSNSALFTQLTVASREAEIEASDSGKIYNKIGERKIDGMQAIEYTVNSDVNSTKNLYTTGTIINAGKLQLYFDISASRKTKKELDAFKTVFEKILSTIQFTNTSPTR